MALEPTNAVRLEIMSPKFIHGDVGDVITMDLTKAQEWALLTSGAVKLADEVESAHEAEPSGEPAPEVTDVTDSEEGNAHG